VCQRPMEAIRFCLLSANGVWNNVRICALGEDKFETCVTGVIHQQVHEYVVMSHEYAVHNPKEARVTGSSTEPICM
jgi:hypothetical protein